MHSSKQDQVLKWWESEQRDFPWRQTRDPWAILVSEFMLQQTQTQRVIPKYQKFLYRFPTVYSCSESTPAAVIELWSGLGYNRRAKNLHSTAQIIVSQYDGAIPNRLEALRSLPGIGEYTARAILSFAFELDVAVVDVNVRRVLSRIEGKFLSNGESQEIADKNLPAHDGWRWNQAMIEIGSTICTSKKVNCRICPLRDNCAWVNNPEIPDPSLNPERSMSKAEPFVGSDRQGRGKLVEELRGRDVTIEELGTVMGWPEDPDRCFRVLNRLINDGLVIENKKGEFSLPK